MVTVRAVTHDAVEFAAETPAPQLFPMRLSPQRQAVPEFERAALCLFASVHRLAQARA
jgi:hypothetical protein